MTEDRCPEPACASCGKEKPLRKLAERYRNDAHLHHPWVCLVCHGIIVITNMGAADAEVDGARRELQRSGESGSQPR